MDRLRQALTVVGDDNGSSARRRSNRSNLSSRSLSHALKTCMSSQCITRADACKVIRALVLGQTEEDIRMAVSPLTFGKFEYRWKL